MDKETSTALQKQGVQLPGSGAISICGDECQVDIRMSAQGLLANMSTDAAAFEGWALVLRTWCGVAKVTLTWAAPPDGKPHQNQAYQRFLYRVFRFRELFSEWFAVSKSDGEWVPFAVALGRGRLLLNEPHARGRSGKNRAHNAGDERAIAENGVLSEVKPRSHSESEIERLLCGSESFKLFFKLYQVDRQRPVGLFSDKIANKTRIFSGGASAIDIVGFTNQTLSIFELKRPGNIKVGVISELLFYATVIRDTLGDSAPFKFAGTEPVIGTAVHSSDIKRCTHIHAVLLHNDIHPLLGDRRIFRCINKAASKYWNEETGRARVDFRMAAYSIHKGSDFSFTETTS
jgi:hypothetical protein